MIDLIKKQDRLRPATIIMDQLRPVTIFPKELTSVWMHFGAAPKHWGYFPGFVHFFIRFDAKISLCPASCLLVEIHS